MAKSSKGKSAEDYRSVGTTFDGIKILKPKTKPVSFTTAEIRETIARVLGNAAKAETGRVAIDERPPTSSKIIPSGPRRARSKLVR